MAVETSGDRNFSCFFCIKGSEKDPTAICGACGRTINVGPLLIGAVVQGHELKRYIDRGYYGATFEAQNGIGKSFAIKLVPVELYRSRDKSFDDEIRYYSGLGHHPNIAELFNAGNIILTVEGVSIEFHFTIMEWIEGVTFGKFVRSVPISASMLYGATLDLAAAMARFEERNLWHNDLNGQNILVSKLSEEEIQTRRSQSEYTLKIVDTGSTVLRTAFGHAQLDDFAFFGQHLNALRSAADRNIELSREDRFFLETLKRLIAKLMDEDPARRTSNAREIAQEVTALYQARLDQLYPHEVRLSSPFDYLNANDFPSPAYINALFSDGFPWISEITKAAAQSLLLTGPRGSGKTMILRSMRLRTKLETSPRQPKLFSEVIADAEYVAFFVSARLEIGNHILTTKLPDWVQREEVVIAYFHLLYLFEICETLQYAAVRRDMAIDAEGERAFVSLLSTALGKRVFGLGSAMEAIRVVQAQIIDKADTIQVSPSLADGALLSKVAQSLAAMVPELRNKSIVFLLDDFSVPKIPPHVQRILLPIVWNSGGGYSFRVSAHSESVEFRDIRDTVYQTGRDFRELSLGAEYVDSFREEAGRLLIDASVSDMFAKRVGLSQSQIDVKALTGTGRPMPIAREIRRRSQEGTLRGIRYSGWETILDLCSGDVSYIIDVIGLMMASREPGATIPVSAQSREIRQYARRELVRLQDHSSEIANLYEIAFNFGRMSLFKLQNDDVTDRDGTRPAEHLRIEVQLDDGSSEARQLISEVLRNGVFIDGGVSASSRGIPARRLVFRKMFTPAFPTTFRNRETFAWTSVRFVKFARDPATLLREFMAEAGIGPDQQQYAFDRLFNPED